MSILAWNLPYLVLFFWYVIALPDDQRQQKILLAVSYILFLFTSLFYSLPPIRAKAKPFLDGTFNILYILP
ncbi:hypothetical protein GW750_05760 [bacterium]|nr:hypothetical protein [bacterium]